MLLIAGDEQDVWSCHGENSGQNSDNISMTQSSDNMAEELMDNETDNITDTEKKPVKRGALHRNVGRRTSDWVMPILFWLIGFSAFLAAWHYHQRTVELERLNATLQEQVHLLERDHKK